MADFNPDDFIAQASQAPAATTPQPQPTPSQAASPGDFDPDSFINDTLQDKYGGLGQQAIAGLEGVGRGVIGPFATGAERLAGVNPEDIRGRQEANPITAGVGEAAGLTGGLLTGYGEGAAMAKAGELAAGALGLGQVAKDASLGFKVGSAAVKGAAEMAVLQSGDEASKMLVNDPDASAQSALANIGMAAAFGGAGGAFFTGAVNPLWEAVGGPKLTEMLSGIRNHANGTPLTLPADTQQALDKLGIEVSPATRAALSGDPKATEMWNHLREAQHPEILGDIEALKQKAGDSVLQSLGIDPEMVANHSVADAGADLKDAVIDAAQKRYGPLEAGYAADKAISDTIQVPDEAKLATRGKMIESGMQTFGTDSPLYDTYEKWSDRVLAKDTVGQLDTLKNELSGELSKAYRSGDNNMIKALSDIKGHINELQTSQILNQAQELEAQGAEHAGAVGKDIVSDRLARRQAYSEFANTMGELTGHLGIGDFKGFGALKAKLADVAPETLARKFSPKNNSEIIPFLQQHFPEVAELVRKNEAASLVKSAIVGAKDGQAINMTKLSNTIKSNMAGRADYVKWVMPEEALSKIQAAETLQNAIPSFKSSGTAGWMMKMMKNVPMSAMAMVGMMTGHNPVVAGILGELGERVGVGAPNAIRLAALKFMGSTEPVSATGFRAAVGFIDSTIKGENMLAKGTKAVFKSGAQVLTDSQMPNKADREKIDKQVDAAQTQPDVLLKMSSGHTGHYLPDHQQAMAQATQRTLGYLSSIKPKPTQLSPLSKPIPPSKAAEARYNRALDIAQQPLSLLSHLKNGTLQPTDVQDIQAMYPALYNRMQNHLMNQISSQPSNEAIIPYKTRMAVSMFMGQPLDASMQPGSIQAAQSNFMPPAPPQPQGNAKGRPSAMKDKGAKAFQTMTQSAEADRSGRD